jgi:hypothetical protein
MILKFNISLLMVPNGNHLTKSLVGKLCPLALGYDPTSVGLSSVGTDDTLCLPCHGQDNGLVLVFFVNSIRASEVDLGIEFKPGANPSTTPFFDMGLHLSTTRWFYRTPPTLIGRLQLTPA